MSGLRQGWDERDYYAFLHECEQKQRAKLAAKAATPKEEDEPSPWWRGQLTAEMLIANSPEAVPFRLERARKEREALEEFHYGDPETAHLKLAFEESYKKEELAGEIERLALECKLRGIHVPTQDEREQEAIDRLVEMEGVVS